MWWCKTLWFSWSLWWQCEEWTIVKWCRFVFSIAKQLTQMNLTLDWQAICNQIIFLQCYWWQKSLTLHETAWWNICLSSSFLHSLSCDPSRIYPQTVCFSSTQFVEVQARHYMISRVIILMYDCLEWHKTNTSTSIPSENNDSLSCEDKSDA